MLNSILFGFVDKSIDVKSQTNSTTQRNQQYFKSNSEKSEIEALKAKASNAAVAENNSDTSAASPTQAAETNVSQPAANTPSGKKYADKSFTVLDGYTHKLVTMNGYDLVCHVVRNEVGAHDQNGNTIFHKETIKAYAVAAYTYLDFCQSRGITANVCIKDDVSQSLKDYVSEVDGKEIFYDGKPICATYCSSTGGRTLSSENSNWSSYPYLKSVESKYDSKGKQYSSTATFTAQQIKKYIEGSTDIRLSDDPSNWFKIISTVDGKYVDKLIIDGHSSCKIYGKEYSITGFFFRDRIIKNRIKSSAFTVSYANGKFTFVTYGNGHCIGMPAEGAELYAQYENFSFSDILTHYYTNVIIK